MYIGIWALFSPHFEYVWQCFAHIVQQNVYDRGNTRLFWPYCSLNNVVLKWRQFPMYNLPHQMISCKYHKITLYLAALMWQKTYIFWTNHRIITLKTKILCSWKSLTLFANVINKWWNEDARHLRATSRANLSSGVCDQLRLKPANSATETN